jgi:hypothetical protein
MPKSLRCPACDRTLPLPAEPGPMVCDGCHHRFDASNPQEVALPPRIPAPWPRRVIGWTLIAFSALVFLDWVVKAALFLTLALSKPGSMGREVIFQMAGAFMVPFLLFWLGSHLAKGRVVETPEGKLDDPGNPVAAPPLPDQSSN